MDLQQDAQYPSVLLLAEAAPNDYLFKPQMPGYEQLSVSDSITL